MNTKSVHRLNRICVLIATFSAQTVLAANLNIIPSIKLPTAVFSGQRVSAYFTVTNLTNTARNGYTLQGLPATVTQNVASTNCSNPINLAPHASCQLQLDIIGGVSSKFALCKGTSCTTSSVSLNVTQLSFEPRVAVGYYHKLSGVRVPLSYISTNNGFSWSLSETLPPLPTDMYSSQTSRSELQSVACDKSRQYCHSVGNYSLGTGPGNATYNGTIPFLYTSSNGGNSWVLSSLALPSDILATSEGSSDLTRIVCDTTGQKCITVGYYRKGSGPGNATYNGTAPLAYISINGGNNWIPSNGGAPFPSPSSAITGSTANIRLQSVACSESGLQCTAVGMFSPLSTGINPFVSYVTSDGGNSWHLGNPLPLPPLATGSGFSIASVACDRTGLKCVTVGRYYDETNGIIPLSYTSINGGGSWSLSAPFPLAADGIPDNGGLFNLFDVTCNASGTSCNTVGLYGRGTGPDNTLSGFVPLSYFSSNGGVSWNIDSQIALPNDAIVDSSSNTDALFGIICNSSGLLCTAVGHYAYTGSTEESLPLGYNSSNGGTTLQLSNKFPLPLDSASMPYVSLASVY